MTQCRYRYGGEAATNALDALRLDAADGELDGHVEVRGPRRHRLSMWAIARHALCRVAVRTCAHHGSHASSARQVRTLRKQRKLRGLQESCSMRWQRMIG